ncbi:MAG: DUF4194 domain-containing protein [Treponema sp.]|nr:DUF4194 domain-containing protein [Treponema sp.]
MNLNENTDMNIDPVLLEGTGLEQTDDRPSNVLFAGDTGELPLETRRALTQLLSGPSLERQRHSNLWPVLLRDEEIIRRRLADMFLELVIDRDLQVAFTRQADMGEEKVPLLLRRSRLTFIDSVLLLYLRRRLIQAESRSERAVISKDEIVEYLNPYSQTGNTDSAGFTKKVYNSIEKYKERSILQGIRSSDDRFEISPTLKLLFSADEIQALGAEYQSMAAGIMPVGDEEPDQDDGEES